MKCPACNQSFTGTKITPGPSKGLNIRFACPHCGVPLIVPAKVTYTKLVGFVMMIIGVAVSLMTKDDSLRLMMSAVTLTGAAISVFGALQRPVVEQGGGERVGGDDGAPPA